MWENRNLIDNPIKSDLELSMGGRMDLQNGVLQVIELFPRDKNIKQKIFLTGKILCRGGRGTKQVSVWPPTELEPMECQQL